LNPTCLPACLATSLPVRTLTYLHLLHRTFAHTPLLFTTTKTHYHSNKNTTTSAYTSPSPPTSLRIPFNMSSEAQTSPNTKTTQSTGNRASARMSTYSAAPTLTPSIAPSHLSGASSTAGDPKSHDIKTWNAGFDRLEDKRLVQQRYALSTSHDMALGLDGCWQHNHAIQLFRFLIHALYPSSAHERFLRRELRHIGPQAPVGVLVERKRQRQTDRASFSHERLSRHFDTRVTTLRRVSWGSTM
jgi:hypothetical protein